MDSRRRYVAAWVLVMPQRNHETTKPVLLLLEKDPLVRRSLQMVLQGQGYNVCAYASPAMLLAASVAMQAACLVTEYRLADMSGIDVLAVLRARGWAGPSILITSEGSNEVTQQALSAGFEAVLQKPLRHFSLAKMVMRLVRMDKMKRADLSVYPSDNTNIRVDS